MFGQTCNSNTNPFGSTTAGFAAYFGFGNSTSPAFGTNTIPAFGVSSSPFAARSTSFTFGTSTTALGFGQLFDASRSPFGVQTATQTIGHTAAAVARHQGSAAAAYRSTPVKELKGGREVTNKLQSITTMPEYVSVSIEELRFQDYELGNKGCNNSTTQKPFSFPQIAPSPFTQTPSPFGVQTATQTVGHTAAAVARNQGSTAAAYRCTPVKELEGNREVTKKLQSITAMPESASVNFEELRFQHYELRNKGGNNTFPNSTTQQPFSFPQISPSPFPWKPSQPTQTPSPSTGSSTPSISLFKTTPTPIPTQTSTLFPNPFNTCNVNPPFFNPWSFTQVTSPSPSTTSHVNPPFPNPWTSTQVTTPSPPSIFTFTPPTPSNPPPRNSSSTPTQSPFPFPSRNIFTPTQPQPSITTMPQPNNLAQQQPQQQQQQQQQQVLLVPSTNPFGMPRVTPQVANGGTVQYGISSIPVVDSPARTNVRVSSSLLHARNQIRSSFKSRINDLYNKKKNASSDHQRVPFFM